MIENTGSTKTTINNKMINKMDWKATYDGSNADINLNMDASGKKQHVSMKLNNEDLKNILNLHQDTHLLDQRLMNDFPLKEYTRSSYNKNNLKNILNKMNTKSKINKNKQKRTTIRKKRKGKRTNSSRKIY